MSDLTAVDILEGAAEILTVNEWAKGRYYRHSPEGGNAYCAIGAMRATWSSNSSWAPITELLHEPEFVKAVQELRDHLYLDGGVGPGARLGGIPQWNDRVARNVDEVIEAMRQTAKDLRNRA